MKITQKDLPELKAACEEDEEMKEEMLTAFVRGFTHSDTGYIRVYHKLMEQEVVDGNVKLPTAYAAMGSIQGIPGKSQYKPTVQIVNGKPVLDVRGELLSGRLTEPALIYELLWEEKDVEEFSRCCPNSDITYIDDIR